MNGLRTDNDEDVGKMDEWGLRASIAGPLADNLSAYASVRYNEFDGPNNTWVRELDPDQLEHPNIVATSSNPRHERDTIGLMLELVLSLDGVDVTSVTLLHRHGQRALHRLGHQGGVPARSYPSRGT